MRVAMVSGSLPPDACGIGDYSARLADALGRLGGFQVECWTRRGWAGGAGEDARANLGFGPAGMLDLVKAIRRFRPDLVHLQFPTQGYGRRIVPWLLPVVARAMGVAVVVTWHEHLATLVPRELLSAAVCAGVVVVRPDFSARMRWPLRLVLGRTPLRFIPGASALPTVALDEHARAAERRRLGVEGGIVVGYFGFVYPAKGVADLFRILDPQRHRLLLIGQLDPREAYQAEVHAALAAPPWSGRAVSTGFLPAEAAARALAACDAVLLPFRDGGGVWNSSLHAALQQGTPVVTTGRDPSALAATGPVRTCLPGDAAGLQAAVDAVAGQRVPTDRDADAEWRRIAGAHRDLYAQVLAP